MLMHVPLSFLYFCLDISEIIFSLPFLKSVSESLFFTQVETIFNY